jgi:hypothetical protein
MTSFSLKRPIPSRLWTPPDRPDQVKRPKLEALHRSEFLLRPESGRFALFRLIEVIYLID